MIHPTPTQTLIGENLFHVSPIPFSAFEPAITIASWIADSGISMDQLEQMTREQAMHVMATAPALAAPLRALVAACVQVEDDGKAQAITPAQVDHIPLATMTVLLVALVEANVDFFTQLLPTLTAAAARLTAKAGQTGGESPSSSSAQDTATATSSATA